MKKTTENQTIPFSLMLMYIGLPLIFLTLCYIALCAAFPNVFMADTIPVHRACVMMLEHTLMSLCLIVGGSALCRYVIESER